MNNKEELKKDNIMHKCYELMIAHYRIHNKIRYLLYLEDKIYKRSQKLNSSLTDNEKQFVLNIYKDFVEHDKAFKGHYNYEEL